VFSLTENKALVIGIANGGSIAFGCAKAFRAQGADLGASHVGSWVSSQQRYHTATSVQGSFEPSCLIRDQHKVDAETVRASGRRNIARQGLA
jgi:enoyl-[acyl-carrier protein] reductase I